jgi:hypothetical protein
MAGAVGDTRRYAHLCRPLASGMESDAVLRRAQLHHITTVAENKQK